MRQIPWKIVLAGLAACVGVGVSLGVVGGCSGSVDGTGDEQDVTSACQVFSVRDGKALSAKELDTLGDPVAKRILQGAGACPQSLDGILKRASESKDCKNGQITTRVVSERAVLRGEADTYRGVWNQSCGGGTDHDLFVSIFGI